MSHCDFNLFSVMTNGTEYTFICLLVICISFLVTLFFKYFAHIKITFLTFIGFKDSKFKSFFCTVSWEYLLVCSMPCHPLMYAFLMAERFSSLMFFMYSWCFCVLFQKYFLSKFEKILFYFF